MEVTYPMLIVAYMYGKVWKIYDFYISASCPISGSHISNCQLTRIRKRITITYNMSNPLHSTARPRSVSSTKTHRSPPSQYDPLSAALAAAQARYTVANPESLKAHNDACQDLPGGNTRTVLHSSPFPMTFGKYNYPPFFCTEYTLCII